MSLWEYAKLKVPVSRAALKTDFQNVSNSAKGTSISSSTKIGLLFFFLQRGSKLKHQGSPYFQVLCCSQVSGATSTNVSEIQKNRQHYVHKATNRNRGWESAGVVQKAHQPSRSLQGLFESGCQLHRANHATWIYRAMPVSEPENTEGNTMPWLRAG